MASVSIVRPTGRPVIQEAQQYLELVMQKSHCQCGNHEPWKCTSGKHSIQRASMGGSVVHWARNQVIAMAMYGPRHASLPPAEYFFLMDDDMVGRPGDLCRMLSYRLDIVTGISTIRRDPPIPNIRKWNELTGNYETIPTWDFESQRLFQVDAVGAAFMLVKRRVFEKMGEAWLSCHFERAEDKRKAPSAAEEIDAYWDIRAKVRTQRFVEAQQAGDWKACDQWWFEFVRTSHGLGEFGEDISFCHKARQLGFKIWADPQITPGHLGNYAYSLIDYRDSLSGDAQLGYVVEEEKKAVLAEA